MSSNFGIQSPYLLSKLPASRTRFDGAHGYSVSQVVGGRHDGSRKRRRTELCVGIDHDAVNLYDVLAHAKPRCAFHPANDT